MSMKMLVSQFDFCCSNGYIRCCWSVNNQCMQGGWVDLISTLMCTPAGVASSSISGMELVTNQF
jgi:hypothetical protein